MLIILALVGLFGFAALAVDGGQWFAERRRAQNAADAAVMAAAYSGATHQDWQAAGIASSTANGYDDNNPAENEEAEEDVRIHHPPVRGRYATASETIDPDEYYQVIIRKKVPQVFSQIVFGGDLWVEVEAVARGTEQKGFPSGAALVATCPQCCDALWFSGTGDILINGGSAISNSNRTGDKNCYSTTRNGGALLDINGGSLVMAGKLSSKDNKECKDKNGNKVACITSSGGVHENAPNPFTYSYPFKPSCKGLSTYPVSKYNKSATLYPGNYPNGISISGKSTVINLEPGMYCLGNDFSASSGSVIGSNVMFYIAGGGISLNTNDPVSLQAPTEENNCIADPDLSPACWSGFLVYMPYENNAKVFFAGGGSTNYTGTIYAPGPPKNGHKCEFVGSQEETTINSSIICYSIKVSGTNMINIHYDDELNAQSPGSLELVE